MPGLARRAATAGLAALLGLGSVETLEAQVPAKTQHQALKEESEHLDYVKNSLQSALNHYLGWLPQLLYSSVAEKKEDATLNPWDFNINKILSGIYAMTGGEILIFRLGDTMHSQYESMAHIAGADPSHESFRSYREKLEASTEWAEHCEYMRNEVKLACSCYETFFLLKEPEQRSALKERIKVLLETGELPSYFDDKEDKQDEGSPYLLPGTDAIKGRFWVRGGSGTPKPFADLRDGRRQIAQTMSPRVYGGRNRA